jgi:hypothetical protein
MPNRVTALVCQAPFPEHNPAFSAKVILAINSLISLDNLIPPPLGLLALLFTVQRQSLVNDGIGSE